MFLTIDNWLFDKVFQPFADWFCDHTGRNVHWLAATCAYLYGAIIVARQIYLGANSWIGMAFDALILLIVISMAKKHDRQSENHTSTHLNQYRTNPVLQFLRIVGIPIILSNVWDVFHDDIETLKDLFSVFSSSVFWLFLYFEACETKPPAPPKEKEEAKLASATS